jgi:hypothetical protein
MPDHLTPSELARLSKLEAALTALEEQAAPLKAKRKALLGLERQRAFRARKGPKD